MANLKPVFIDTSSGELKEPRNGDVLINEPDITVDTITDLRNIQSDRYVRTKTARILESTDNSSGLYKLDTSDTTTSDDGFNVIVDTDGGRWKLLSPSFIRKTSSELQSDSLENGELYYDTDENRGVLGSVKRYLVGLRDTGKKVNSISGIVGDTPSWYETLFSATPKRDVLGYYSVGDGGGGTFYWDSSEDKANHNGGTIINPEHNSTIGSANWYSASGDSTDTSGSGCWVRPDEGFVSVKWFGARGDGSSDDFSAIDSAKDNTNKLIFDNGKYKCEGRLNITDKDITILGDNATLIQGIDDRLINISGSYSNQQSVSSISERQLTVSDTSVYEINELIKIASDDAIPNRLSTDAQMGEYNYIESIDSSTTLTVREPLRYSYATSIKIASLDENNVKIKGINLDVVDATGWTSTLLNVKDIYTTNIKDVNIKEGYGIGINLSGLPTYSVEDCNIQNLPNGTIGYGVLDKNCEYGVIENCYFNNVRHGFTTGASGNQNIADAGESWKTRIKNSIAINCLNGWDTHEEGFGIEFISCITSNNSGSGYQVRSPETKIINPVSNEENPFKILHDTKVEGGVCNNAGKSFIQGGDIEFDNTIFNLFDNSVFYCTNDDWILTARDCEINQTENSSLIFLIDLRSDCDNITLNIFDAKYRAVDVTVDDNGFYFIKDRGGATTENTIRIDGLKWEDLPDAKFNRLVSVDNTSDHKAKNIEAIGFGGRSGSFFRTHSGDPTGVLYPSFYGEKVFDETNNKWYEATNSSGNTNWKLSTVNTSLDTYTPTVSIISNISSVGTVSNVKTHQLGGMMFVEMKINDVDPTASGIGRLDVNLPEPANSSSTQFNGSIYHNGAPSIGVLSDKTAGNNTEAQIIIDFKSDVVGDAQIAFSYMI